MTTDVAQARQLAAAAAAAPTLAFMVNNTGNWRAQCRAAHDTVAVRRRVGAVQHVQCAMHSALLWLFDDARQRRVDDADGQHGGQRLRVGPAESFARVGLQGDGAHAGVGVLQHVLVGSVGRRPLGFGGDRVRGRRVDLRERLVLRAGNAHDAEGGQLGKKIGFRIFARRGQPHVRGVRPAARVGPRASSRAATAPTTPPTTRCRRASPSKTTTRRASAPSRSAPSSTRASAGRTLWAPRPTSGCRWCARSTRCTGRPRAGRWRRARRGEGVAERRERTRDASAERACQVGCWADFTVRRSVQLVAGLLASDLHLSPRPTPSPSIDAAVTKMPYTPLGLDTQHSTQYSLAGGGDSAREARLWKLAAGVSAGVAAVFGCALALTAGVGAAPAALLAAGQEPLGGANRKTYAPARISVDPHTPKARRADEAQGDVADLLGRVQVAQAHEVDHFVFEDIPYGVPGNTGDVNIVSSYTSDMVELLPGGGMRLKRLHGARQVAQGVHGGLERHVEHELRHDVPELWTWQAPKVTSRLNGRFQYGLHRDAPQGAEGLRPVAGGVAQRLLRLRRRVDGRVPAAGRLPVPVRPVLAARARLLRALLARAHVVVAPQLAVGPQPQPVRRRARR